MNNKHTLKVSQTDWERIKAMKDRDIDLSDIPEVTEAQLAHGRLRIGGKVVPREFKA